MTMRKIKVKFVDFWASFDPDNNYFTNALKGKIEVEISNDPEILFFSYFGTSHLQYTCHKIQFLGENVAPDFRIADYAISFDYLQEPNHLRLPLYVLLFDGNKNLANFLQQKTAAAIDELVKEKTGFCSFVVSSKDTESRIDFFHHLSAYKKVDSGGSVLNNVGGRVPDKLAFIRMYKFNIAFENATYPGYVTEKLVEAKEANTVPVYWGNPRIAEEMNPKSFINYHDYNSTKALLNRVIEVDNNEALYKEYLREPLFYNNQPNEYFDDGRFVDFFKKIVAEVKDTTPVSKTLRFKFASQPLNYRLTRHRSRKTVYPYKPDW